MVRLDELFSVWEAEPAVVRAWAVTLEDAVRIALALPVDEGKKLFVYGAVHGAQWPLGVVSPLDTPAEILHFCASRLEAVKRGAVRSSPGLWVEVAS